MQSAELAPQVEALRLVPGMVRQEPAVAGGGLEVGDGDTGCPVAILLSAV